MDGDGQHIGHYDQSHISSRFGMGRRAVPRPAGGATDRFRQANALPSARGDTTMLSQAAGRPQMPSSPYVDYGYTGPSFQDTALPRQQGAPQLQPYAPQNFSQQAHHPQVQQHPQQHQQHPQLVPYEQEVVYNFQQGSPHGPYDVVPQYPTRQTAAAIESLSSPFAVPQYFPAGEPTDAAAAVDMSSPYLNSHLPPSTAYNQAGPIGRSSATAQPFAATMSDLTNPLGTQQQQQPPAPAPAPAPAQPHLQPLPPPQSQPQPQPQPAPSQQPQIVAAPAPATVHLDEPFVQFQRALRGTLDNNRAGRLVESSRSLMEISGWLIANVQELGMLQEGEHFHQDQLRIWTDFNLCWLSFCQMQKDLIESWLQTGHQSPHVSLVSAGYLQHMGKELTKFCDQVERHGLVDYQMGIWEEEILSVLSQCLGLMESRPELMRSQPSTTTAATSRS